jgi:hypothetical protein
MEQNCYKFMQTGELTDDHYSVVHFSDIAGWHVRKSLTGTDYFTPFDQNRVVFPRTSDKSIYEAWLKYKNGDLGLSITGTEESQLEFDTKDESIFWNGSLISLADIDGWTCEKDGMCGMISNIAPILIGDIQLPSWSDPAAIIAVDHWRAWQKKEKGIDYPPLN